jgi:hypothetical protein
VSGSLSPGAFAPLAPTPRATGGASPAASQATVAPVAPRPAAPSAPEPKEVYLPPRPGHPLDGIFAHLTRKHGANLHDARVVEASASSSVSADHHAKTVLDFDSQNWYRSIDEKGQWISFEFRGVKIKPTNYTMRSAPAEANGANPRSWVVETSLNGATWNQIDRQDKVMGLKTPDTLACYCLGDCVATKFIRWRQVLKNFADNRELTLGAIELFGTLYNE